MSLKSRWRQSARALTAYWRKHSLSLTFFCGGCVLVAVAIPFQEGTTFDIVSGIGLAAITAGLYNLASGPLVEVNKPETCEDDRPKSETGDRERNL